MNNMKKVLITGGDGFIARNLNEQLSGEFEITSAGRRDLDLLDSEKVSDFVRRGRFDAIVHAATYDAAPKHSIKDPAKVLENNLKMFFILAREKEHFGKMLFFGSGAEFSREHWIPKMSEDYFDRHIPSDQYGFSKYVMTKFAQSSGNVYNLRLFGVFGKYDDWRTRLISSICRDAALNKPIIIKQNKFYDLMDVNDLAKIVKRFINNSPKQNIYNVCSGNVYGFYFLAEKVLKIANKKLDIVVEQTGQGLEYSGDNSRIRSELGEDFDFSSIEDSLEALYNWYVSEINL